MWKGMEGDTLSTRTVHSKHAGASALPQHEEALAVQNLKWLRAYFHLYSSKEILPVQSEQEYLDNFHAGTIWTSPAEPVEQNVVHWAISSCTTAFCPEEKGREQDGQFITFLNPFRLSPASSAVTSPLQRRGFWPPGKSTNHQDTTVLSQTLLPKRTISHPCIKDTEGSSIQKNDWSY